MARPTTVDRWPGFTRAVVASPIYGKLAVGINGVIAVLYVSMLLPPLLRGWDIPNDFTAFYTGWSIVWTGDGASLYNLEVQEAVQETLLDGQRFVGGLNPYTYPPHLVLPFTPLAALPPSQSILIWMLIQLALIAYAFSWLLFDLGAVWSRDERVVALCALLAFPPVFLSLARGSVSPIILALFVRYYSALERGHDSRAGLLLGLATLKPQLTLGGIAMLVGARRWKTLAWGAAVVVVLAVVSLPALGSRVYLDYVGLLAEYTSAFDRYSVTPQSMWNARGTLTLLLGRDHTSLINTLSYAVLIGALVGLALLWRRHWDPGTPAFQLRFALTVIVGLLVSPHLNTHDGLLLTLPAALGYHAMRLETGHRNAYAAFVLACPIAMLLVDQFGLTPPIFGAIRPPVVLAVILAGWLALALHGVTHRTGSARVSSV